MLIEKRLEISYRCVCVTVCVWGEEWVTCVLDCIRRRWENSGRLKPPLLPLSTHTYTHIPFSITLLIYSPPPFLGFLCCPALPLSVLCKSAMFDEPALSTWDQYQVFIWPALANKGKASYPPSGREREKDTHTLSLFLFLSLSLTHMLEITILIILSRKKHILPVTEPRLCSLHHTLLNLIERGLY